MAPKDFLLADLGNRCLKLADPDLHEVHSFVWGDASQRQALRRMLEDAQSAEIHLACSSEAALVTLREEVFQDFHLRVITAQDVPMEVKSRGTGIDRLLAAWIAFEMAGGPVVVADCGSAFTLDVVDRQGCFLGGAIRAGLGVQERALMAACPHLAAASLSTGQGVPRDTATAVAAGTRRAFAHALSGLAAEFLPGFPEGVSRFLTGGDAARLAPMLPGWQQQEDMVLQALRALASRSAR